MSRVASWATNPLSGTGKDLKYSQANPDKQCMLGSFLHPYASPKREATRNLFVSLALGNSCQVFLSSSRPLHFVLTPSLMSHNFTLFLKRNTNAVLYPYKQYTFSINPKPHRGEAIDICSAQPTGWRTQTSRRHKPKTSSCRDFLMFQFSACNPVCLPFLYISLRPMENTQRQMSVAHLSQVLTNQAAFGVSRIDNVASFYYKIIIFSQSNIDKPPKLFCLQS